MILVKVCFYYLILSIMGSFSIQGSKYPVAKNLEASTKDLQEIERIASGLIEYTDCETKVKRKIDLHSKPKYTVLTRDTNKYLLYTRENPDVPEELLEDNIDSVTASTFNAPDQTIFIVHDWMGNWKSKLNPAIRDAFLSLVYANIIVVDWSRIAKTDYVTATTTVPRVASFLVRFLQFLNTEAGASYATMHMVGFGVGAHLVGIAAQELQPTGLIARITGLDPAGPLWANRTWRLSPKDALYVEAIHTNGAMLGSDARFGAVDFYPNGGRWQPGCSAVSQDSCSHSRAWRLFAATVRYNHLLGRRCSSDAALGLNMCYHDYLAMGNDDLLKNGSGVYRLNTDGTYPYHQLR